MAKKGLGKGLGGNFWGRCCKRKQRRDREKRLKLKQKQRQQRRWMKKVVF